MNPSIGTLDPLARAVLARTPISALRVGWLGAGAEAFAKAAAARNPAASVAAPDASCGPLDVLAATDLAAALDPAPLSVLGPNGVVVAVAPTAAAPRAEAARTLQALGFEVLKAHLVQDDGGVFDDAHDNRAGTWAADEAGGAPMVVVARRAGGPPPLHLNQITFAPTLMDIRTRLPAEALRSEADVLVAHQKVPASLPALPVEYPKVLVLQRPGPRDPDVWRRSIAQQIAQGWVVVLEYDDHPELVALHNRRTMSEADWIRFSGVHAVQTTTPALEAAFKPHNPEVRVFPNAVFDLPPFPEAAPRRVFYGAVSRGPFAARVAASLGPALEAAPDVEVFVVGDRAVFEALPTHRKRFFDFLPYEEYLALMALCAVSLSPVEGSLHQETKSDAKFLDAAGRGVLTIASPVIYDGVIRHGENGLIARTLDDWSPLLARALEDPAGARAMARAAWTEVRAHRMFADQARARIDWCRDLWNRREALNAALRSRLGL